MGDNQLSTLAQADEDQVIAEGVDMPYSSAVPTQYVTAIPLGDTVDVSLARKIVAPGSNRVMCLAAQTSVPIADDELASVTDMRLRLSDGTNVVLSLSCFNDVMGAPSLAAGSAGGGLAPFGGGGSAGLITMRPTFFDPDRYRVKSDSRLPMTLTMIIAGLALGAYLSINCLAPAKFSKLTVQDAGSTHAGKLLKDLRDMRSSAKKQVAKIKQASSASKQAKQVAYSGSLVEREFEDSADNGDLDSAKSPAGLYTEKIVDAPISKIGSSPRVSIPGAGKSKILRQNRSMTRPAEPTGIDSPRKAKSAKSSRYSFVPPPPPTEFDIGSVSGFQWQLVPTGATVSPMIANEQAKTTAKNINKPSASAPLLPTKPSLQLPSAEMKSGSNTVNAANTQVRASSKQCSNSPKPATEELEGMIQPKAYKDAASFSLERIVIPQNADNLP